jgi:hypothetical protein
MTTAPIELPPAQCDGADFQGGIDEIAEEAALLEGIDGHELTLTTCRFPLWGKDERVNHRYCGRPMTVENAIYCDEHRAVCLGTRRTTSSS